MKNQTKPEKAADVLEMLVKGNLPLCLGSTAIEKSPAQQGGSAFPNFPSTR